MATGMAIMGFGGGALIGAPFGSELLRHFATPHSTGVMEAFLVMGAVYFCFMVFGSMTVRVPPPGWKPEGFVPRTVEQELVTTANVTADEAIKTPQFWLLWAVLCLNVTAGIGILGQASNMCQSMFGVPKTVGDGFAGFLSIFNMGGRFFWSSTSDYTGRKRVYFIYFLLGAVLYCLVPLTQRMGNVAFFVGVTALIISMYGGGFATIPAYLRDMFGTMQVGAIHGRLITAWSMAAVLGPQLVTYISEYQKSRNVPVAQSYNFTMYLMAALLVIGACCNACIRAVDRRHHWKGEKPS
jgi:Na+/melibiose symporter-like transporter